MDTPQKRSLAPKASRMWSTCPTFWRNKVMGWSSSLDESVSKRNLVPTGEMATNRLRTTVENTELFQWNTGNETWSKQNRMFGWQNIPNGKSERSRSSVPEIAGWKRLRAAIEIGTTEHDRVYATYWIRASVRLEDNQSHQLLARHLHWTWPVQNCFHAPIAAI